MIHLKLKRVYETAEETDGTRSLVERLWPRGISKENARLDGWLKQAAPSPELRKWYGHDASKWAEFRRRYFAEQTPKRLKAWPCVMTKTESDRRMLSQASIPLHHYIADTVSFAYCLFLSVLPRIAGIVFLNSDMISGKFFSHHSHGEK